MKRVVLSAVLAVVSLSPSLKGSATQCLNKEDACKGVPCEFLSRLKYAQAEVRTYSTYVQTPPTDEQVVNDIDESFKLWNQYDNCWGKKFEEEVPLANVRPPACVVGMKGANGQVTPATLDQVKKASSGCSELVEAEYQRAVVAQGQCTANQKNGGRPLSNARTYADKLAAAQARLDSLESSLSQYLNSCAPDGHDAAELSKLKLDKLMQDSKEVRDSWLAKRFGVSVR